MEASERLAARVQDLLGPRHPVFAAATLTPGTVTVAGRGADSQADFEIASVSKAITGLLYAEGLARAEFGADAVLGDHLPLGDTPAAGVSLASLSTHRSGLPRLPASAHPWRRTIALWRHGTNPYGETLDDLLEQARGVRVGRPLPRYSNFGFELLGHAIAAAEGTTYAALVRDRLVGPLDLDPFYVPTSTADLRPGALSGRSARGRTREAWTGEALGPAGGIRASIEAMARLAAALLAGSAPGMAALNPVAPFGAGARIGAAWITVDVDGRAITWHNGGSGGFRSWLGLDRAAGTAAVILSATAAAVDAPGFRLLTELTAIAAE
ncbi:class A beta-lactamase-related serine hydrolase [Occultella glacieicola]|uniref:Class A beta-lactamase-related serine hydrolase n=1 Tax=Occultella glacieicola TaxID=2518684 RepID=A0ABY2E7P0_9MICO|nr:serine hydrolase domain-containing protein [Occultella glacieicola]TDE97564.1 class A beta-lactamase-related serine hydrolase [Occultella glacieicola]